MMRRSRFFLDKLIVVESPTKMKKIDSLLKDKKVIPDWSFGGQEVFKKLGKGGPEAAVSMATSGHFMALSELTWEMVDSATAATSNTAPAAANTTSDSAAGNADTTTTTSSATSPAVSGKNGIQARFNLLWETIPSRRIHEALARHLHDENARNSISEIIVATDPDREGELIAMHVYQLMQKVFPGLSIPFTRAYMHSLTVEGIQTAMRQRSMSFDWNLAHAAEARHAMDRIFGFLGSTVVRHAHSLMRSIGRVQTPSLILIREREERIKAFASSHPKYYEVCATCTFRAKGAKYTQTVTIKPQKDSPEAAAMAQHRENKEEMEKQLNAWGVKDMTDLRVTKEPRLATIISEPPEPFTMAALLTRANRLLHLSSSRVSLGLQELFQQGYITYPRTDSTRIDAAELDEIYKVVRKEFGDKLVKKRKIEAVQGRKAAGPGDPPTNVEDAHEAIRPTNILLTTKKLPATLSPAAQQLYDLIRRNTLASCMIPMHTEKIQVLVEGKSASGAPLHFKLEGRHTKRDGWALAFTAGLKKRDAKAAATTAAGVVATDGADAVKEASNEMAGDDQPTEELVPMISNEEFQALVHLPKALGATTSSAAVEKIISISSIQLMENTPAAPLPYSEGGLIADLRRNGVGRPSTYPLIVHTLLERQYISLNKQGRCETTDVGKLLVDVSRSIFPAIVDIGFTAKFEKQLDMIAKPGNNSVAEEDKSTANIINNNNNTDNNKSESIAEEKKEEGDSGEKSGEEEKNQESALAAANSPPTAAAVGPLSPMDRVLSQFTSDFLSYVVDATRQQRAHLAERSLTILSAKSDNTVSADGSTPAEPPKPEVVAKERERAMSLVPDLLKLSTQYRTFTAVQSNLREYLWRNFPRPSTTSDGSPLPPSDSGSQKKGGRKTTEKKKAADKKKATKKAKSAPAKKKATAAKK